MFAELDKDIEDLIEIIDDIINSILSLNSSFSMYTGSFVELCMSTFPKIVLSYTDERLNDYSEDMKYWTDLLARIIQALRNVDKYKIIDLLHFEAKVSLSEYRKMLRRLELINE